jgi:hypothetical protein
VHSGADYVFHSASPVVLQSENPQEDIVDPAVKVSRQHEPEKAAAYIVLSLMPSPHTTCSMSTLRWISSHTFRRMCSVFHD